MFDWDDLVRRPPLSSLPLTLIAPQRSPHAEDWDAAVMKAVTLLANRHREDEVLLIVPSAELGEPIVDHYRGCRVVLVPSPEPAGGAILTQLLAEPDRRPSVLLTDDQVSLDHRQLRDLIQRLDFCDLVAVRRRSAPSGWRWPVERLLRGLLAVPLTDPLCSITLFRQAALAGVPLQVSSPLRVLELVAKLTYFAGTLDETVWPDGPGPRGVLATLFAQGEEFRTLLASPRFFQAEETGVAAPAKVLKKPALHQLRAPLGWRDWSTPWNRPVHRLGTLPAASLGRYRGPAPRKALSMTPRTPRRR